PLKEVVDDPDRRTLLYLLSFLLAGFDQIRASQVPLAAPSPEWLDHWDDENFVYLETRIPRDSSELEIDLNVHDGVIFARVARRRADMETQVFTDNVDPDVSCVPEP